MDHCCPPALPSVDRRFRRALVVALVFNAAMFAVELATGFAADSVSLLADATDFAGDAANYALTFWALALAPAWRSRAAIAKALSMGAYGVFVLALTAWHLVRGTVPEPAAMGLVGMLALIVNASVAVMLYRFREGDANMRSVWLCSRNDAVGNVAVILAAAGVFGTGGGWPDHLVALLLATLALSASAGVLRHARREILGAA